MRTVYRALGGDGPLGLLSSEQSIPTPSGDELVVAIEAAAISSADVRAVTGGGAIAVTPGRSGVGRVVATGDAATEFAGARVAIGGISPCGECDRCRRGVISACTAARTLGVDVDGTLASHVVARARWAMRLDDVSAAGDAALELDDDAASLLAGDAADAYALYCRCGVTPGTPVVVLGSGPRATIVQLIGTALGTDPIMASAAGEPPADDSDPVRGKPWSVIVAGTVSAADRSWLAAIEPGSTISIERGAVIGDVAPLLDRGCRLLGAVGAHPDLLPELAALVARDEVDLATVAAREPRTVTADRAEALTADGKVAVVAGP